MLNAHAMSAMFFTMYCPSSVGTSVFCQTSDIKNSGSIVVNIWNENSDKATFSILGIKNNIPITISNKPNRTMKEEKGKNGIVFASKDFTIGLAGDCPSIFNVPNQK